VASSGIIKPVNSKEENSTPIPKTTFHGET
jgi:hypothetical protein